MDANYSLEITREEAFFQEIIEYHRDGVRFWKERGVHHPFMLDSYPLNRNTGGVPYHRKFSWLGLRSEYAEEISFIELLPVPTTGKTEPSAFWAMFDEKHACQIDRLILGGERRLVLLSKTLFSKYMRIAREKYGVFPWLPSEFKLGPKKTIGETLIYGAPHFSSTPTKEQIESLGAEARKFCTQKGG